MKKIGLFFKISISKRSASSFHFSTSSPTYPPYCLTSCSESLRQFGLEKSLRKGQQLHAQMLTTGLSACSPTFTTALISLYAKCNQMNQALLVFNSSPDCDRNVFMYNTIIFGFVSNGLARDGLEVYREMRKVGVLPDKVTFPCLIKGFCEVMEVCEVKKIHGLVFKLGAESDVFVGSALVSCYLKFEFTDEAHKLFNEMADRDVILWNSMVNGCAQIGKINETWEVFRRMRKEGIPLGGFTYTGVLSVFALARDFNKGRVVHGLVIKTGFGSCVPVCNALIDVYGKCNFFASALEIFEVMDGRDIFSWNSIISVNEQSNDPNETLRLFNRMLSDGFHPDLVTITKVLPACSRLAALMHGREIHRYVIVNGLDKAGNSEYINNVLLNNAIIDMYAKCGSLRDAQSVFNEINCKDVASWNIMIMGYGMHGFVTQALHMFSSMCDAGHKPSEVTFLGVLSACSHAGFVSEGQEFIRLMKLKYGMDPTIEHYACIIDMLGRAGQLEDAYKLACTMPVKAESVVWRTLLAACQLHGNVDLAELAAEQVFELEPGCCGNYVLMSNVYTAVGQYGEVLDVRHQMRQQNVNKAPGCSWIELKNGRHTFIAGDQTHPEANRIYSTLYILTSCLHEQGHMPNL
ncbi:pentatricopeptide repeat-containing protein At3g14730 [Euphorbia lathyris]|uniref:pentatricopeptide repeat-containing protein At3g14730 n=1 Tax=Euphorbia lathyris TaxID=212925 RepID=UPI0033132AC4